jgi:2-phospho-L-lactate/phosphoenolpyruvate guanylyltransferase
VKWTALVPLKTAAIRKSRLATRLGQDERIGLSQALLGRLLEALHAVPRITGIVLIADEAARDPTVRWIADQGRGLNAELEAARIAIGAVPLLVIHADLPFVGAPDLEAFLDAAEQAGSAIAPDRHDVGTNALALANDSRIAFRFGASSFADHHAQAGEGAVIRRRGLALDCDTPDDLDLAIAGGFVP